MDIIVSISNVGCCSRITDEPFVLRRLRFSHSFVGGPGEVLGSVFGVAIGGGNQGMKDPERRVRDYKISLDP